MFLSRVCRAGRDRGAVRHTEQCQGQNPPGGGPDHAESPRGGPHLQAQGPVGRRHVLRDRRLVGGRGAKASTKAGKARHGAAKKKAKGPHRGRDQRKAGKSRAKKKGKIAFGVKNNLFQYKIEIR